MSRDSGRPPLSLAVTRDYAASAERVFDAWLDPDMARRFLFATSDGEMLQVQIDARVGGEALIVERRAQRDARHRMRFEVIDRPRRLVFLFAAGMDGEADADWSRVAIDIVSRDGGGCTLTLHHELDPAWSDWADRTRAGWTMMLDTLATLTGDS
ncbi:MAG: SRPBCC domain-containing protein [Sphingomonas sp.]